MKIKILILASNPRKDLNLDREIRDLQGVIERSRNRAELEVEVGLAVRVGDLQDLLFQHQPQIVHFCGHGSGAEGLVFEGNEGEEQWLRADALSGLFRFFPGVSCVLLNACYSEAQADAIVTHIDYVIGMRQTIRDDAAIAFSKGFYRALGYDCSIEQSYGVGCNAIQLEISGSSRRKSPERSTVSEQQRRMEVVEAAAIAIPEHDKPVLKKKASLSDDAGFIPAEAQVAIQVEVSKALEEEDSSQKQYRDQVREYLADRQLSDHERFFLDQLRDDLGLSVEETEAIIQQELAPIQEAQQAYARRLTGLIAGGFDPLDAEIQQELKRFQARRNLTDAEVEAISQPIFAEAEAARQAEMQQQAAQRRQEVEEKQHRYRQELLRATEAAYPIADSIRLALKSFQQQIGLSDEAVAAIEQPILERLEAEHQERLRQQEADCLRKEQAKQHRWNQKVHRSIREAEERQRQLEAYLAEAGDYLRRELKELQLPEQAEIDRLRREKAERQQQAEADRLRRETQKRQKQAETDRLRRETEARQRQEANPPTADRSPSNWSRRRVIRTAGLAAIGAVGTGIAVTGGRLLHVQPKSFTEDLGNGIALEMMQIPGGKFVMGSPDNEKDRGSDESPQHSVTVPPFTIGKFEVTQAQWKAIASLPKVMIDLNADPSKFKGSDRPVENVSWNDAIEFCDRLSGKTGKKYRLPSEAEWEYACRAGTTTPFYFGETLSSNQANYSSKGTIAVGSFPPNAFGLYDMHGNVWEWCADYYHRSYRASYQGAPTDGSAWVEENGDVRVLRGGSWDINPRNCRSASRDNYDAGTRLFNLGFRVVYSVPRT